MKKCLIVLLAYGFLLSGTVLALEIQFPGEQGFFIGEEMTYTISDSSNKQLINQGGILTFGPTKVIIDNTQYYDCVFEYTSGTAHFFIQIDKTSQAALLKGFTFAKTKITLTPTVKMLAYPLITDKKWSENTNVVAENVELPDMPPLGTLEMQQATVASKVTASSLRVPAGYFNNSLMVESKFDGKVMGQIPLTLVQRTWVNEKNIWLKIYFELNFFSKIIPLFGIELTALPVTPVQSATYLPIIWGKLKKI
jgi:hypothetical protein